MKKHYHTIEGVKISNDVHIKDFTYDRLADYWKEVIEKSVDGESLSPLIVDRQERHLRLYVKKDRESTFIYPVSGNKNFVDTVYKVA